MVGSRLLTLTFRIVKLQYFFFFFFRIGTAKMSEIRVKIIKSDLSTKGNCTQYVTGLTESDHEWGVIFLPVGVLLSSLLVVVLCQQV